MYKSLTTRRGIVAILAAPGLVLLAGCSQPKKSNASIKRYAMRGEVVRLEPQRQIAVIKHEKIEGWMEAMTMEFPVRDKSEMAKLAEGKRIGATVFVQDLDYWIGEIQVD
jgi:protein SCO1/2